MADNSERRTEEMKGIGTDAPPATHKSYVLRLWREGVTYRLWRATLQGVSDSTDRHHFPDLDSLVIFLLSQFRSGLLAEESERDS